MLEHLDYFLRLEGRRSSFGYAAYEISKLKEPLSAMKGRLGKIKGVGEKTEKNNPRNTGNKKLGLLRQLKIAPSASFSHLLRSAQ